MTRTCCEPLWIETAAGHRRVQHTCTPKFRQPWRPVEPKRDPIADDPAIAGALLGAAYAVTRQEARDWLNLAVLRGLSLTTADDLLKRWDAVNAPQVVGADR